MLEAVAAVATLLRLTDWVVQLVAMAEIQVETALQTGVVAVVVARVTQIVTAAMAVLV
jgi:hypothetical protein